MAKQKTMAGLLEDIAKIVQRYVRLKASEDGYCQCVTCGKVDDWKNMDGGHFISRKYTIHKILEENIHPQCKRCNRFSELAHDDYAIFMIDMYGEEFVRELIETKHTPKKYLRAELLELKKEWQQRYKDLAKEKGYG
jgi:hypothetical protein